MRTKVKPLLDFQSWWNSRRGLDFSPFMLPPCTGPKIEHLSLITPRHPHDVCLVFISAMAMMENFNMTWFMNERQGCEGNMNNIDSFNDFIQDLGLIYIPLRGELSHGLLNVPHPSLQSLSDALFQKFGMIFLLSSEKILAIWSVLAKEKLLQSKIILLR